MTKASSSLSPLSNTGDGTACRALTSSSPWRGGRRPLLVPRRVAQAEPLTSVITFTSKDLATAAAAAAAAEVSSLPALPSASPSSANLHTTPMKDDDGAALPSGLTSSPLSSPPPPFSSEPLADGTLDLVRWEGDRMLRIWTPAGFHRADPPCASGWPVLYLNDGQNLFKDNLSFSGCSWRAAEAASSLIASGAVPPFVIVGIDHSGKTRSLDYTPYRPGTGPGGFRKDAADWPGGGVDEYLSKLEDEVMPYARDAYGVASDPELVAFGGSSFGGICTLMASMRRPGLFGAALIESPSLWLSEEKVLRHDVASYSGPWPQRMFIGMGGKEFSGIRKPEPGQDAHDSRLAGYVPALEAALRQQGVARDRLMTVVDPGATHSESAWMSRLPSALLFLLAPWWGRVLKLAKEGRGYGDPLYITVPPRVRAGQLATVLVNAKRSDSLSSSASGAGGLRFVAGFNGWSSRLEAAMTPLLGGGAAAAAAGLDGWHAVRVDPPRDAHELSFALSDSKGQVWDNCNGSNFYVRISQLPPGVLRGEIPPVVPFSSSRDGGGGGGGGVKSVDDLSRRMAGQLYFTFPERPSAGRPFTLYVNRRNSEQLRDQHNIKICYGYNNWEMGSHTGNVTPTGLWRSEVADWWGITLESPPGAEDLHFCFTDGQGGWDSNFGSNYAISLGRASQSVDGSTSGEVVEPKVKPRTVAMSEVLDHAGGLLSILTLSKRDSGDKISDRNAKWTEEKVVRVWTPPGYQRDSAPPGGWPVLYVNDAQNKFECWLAHQGVSWRVGYTASELIGSGQVPPFVIVGIDNPGPMRSLNYLPYAPGSGVGGFRGDAARWPGGGVEQYMQRLVQEIMPLVVDKYNLATDPARVAFGGGSFGGVNALYAALHYPHVFGAVLAESPSLWIAEARFLEDMWAHAGMLPERVFMGCGTREYSATRDHERDDVDQLLLHYYQEAARCLESKGMQPGNGRLRFLVEEGAGHHELAWQWRLTGALRFLLGPWRD